MTCLDTRCPKPDCQREQQEVRARLAGLIREELHRDVHLAVLRCPQCNAPITLEREVGPGESPTIGAFCEPCERFQCGYCLRWFGMWEQGGTDTIACDGCWLELQTHQQPGPNSEW